MIEQLGIPAGGPAAAGGGVAVGQADGRAVADDGRGIAFNAQAVTVATRIAVAEASWRAVSTDTGVGVAGRDAGPPNAADGGRAGRVAAGGRARAGAAARGRGVRAGRDAGPAGWAGGRPRTGRRGAMAWSDRLAGASEGRITALLPSWVERGGTARSPIR